MLVVGVSTTRLVSPVLFFIYLPIPKMELMLIDLPYYYIMAMVGSLHLFCNAFQKSTLLVFLANWHFFLKNS